MRTAVNIGIWVLLFLLLLPSSLAVASWNSLPGSHLFSVKLAMEQALVAVVPSYQVKGNLQIAYTERRFSEAKRMLADQSSVQGLTYLDSQVAVTRDAIVNAPDPVVRKQLAEKYIATLQQVSQQLEEQKQIAVASSAAPTPTATPRQVAVNPQPPGTVAPPTQNPIIPPPTSSMPPPSGGNAAPQVPTATPTPPPPPSAPPQPSAGGQPPSSDIVGGINDTQNQINQTINELQQMSTSSEAPNQQGPGNGNGNSENNQNQHGGNEHNNGPQNGGSNNGGNGNNGGGQGWGDH